jgi:hypothetical protein
MLYEGAAVDAFLDDITCLQQAMCAMGLACYPLRTIGRVRRRVLGVLRALSATLQGPATPA